MDDFNDYGYLAKAFNTPKDYILPDDEDFKSDRTKPQLNSYTFTQELYYGKQETTNFLPTYCHIDIVPKTGQILLATNDFNSGITKSTVVGSSKIDGIKDQDSASLDFIYPCNHTISSLKYLYANLIFIGNRNGEAILLSTHNQKSNETTTFYTSRSQLKGTPTAVDYLQSTNELIVGTQQGHLSKFTVESSLQLLTERIHCHSDFITGIAAVSDQNYATCSRDRSCLLWDDRQFPPAKVLLSNFNHQLTAIHCSAKSPQHLIIGDEIGNLHTIDTRNPQEILNKSRMSHREIVSMTSNNKYDLGIVSKSNCVKIAQIDENSEIKSIFEHKAGGIVYDLAWDAVDSESFYIAGENRLFEKLKLSYH